MKFRAEPANFDDSIPTLQKWSKTVDNWDSPIKHRVELIWLPNLYKNYTFQTSSYRFRIPEGHPYFDAIVEFREEWEKEGAVLFLTVSMSPKLTVALESLDEEQCEWNEIGSAGFKLEEVRRRKKTSSPKTRKENPAHSQTGLQDAREGASDPA